jgi:hypothetical protein
MILDNYFFEKAKYLFPLYAVEFEKMIAKVDT